MTTNRLIIDASGVAGQSGQDGSSGYSNGNDGTDGTHGKKGQDAKDIKLSLSIDEFNQQVIVNANSEVKRLPLNYAKASISLKANGGKGGDGGDGGRGADGYRGSDGSDATSSSSGSNGSDGGPGGNGGDAGNGADGGNGGNINIHVDDHDMDLLMLLRNVEAKAGSAGRGGDGGRYGSGGPGGSGGSSYSWTEATYSTTIDSEGNPQMETHYDSHSNSGGSSGSKGRDGESGSSGSNGLKGIPGDIKFHVRNNGTYNGVYDLSLDEVKISSENGVFEPGEMVQVNKIVLKNSGKMPTPSHQPIHISLKNNRWISFDEKNTRMITIPIAPAKQFVLHEPFGFRISEDKSSPLVNSTFQKIGSLNINAELQRVNFHFPRVAEDTRAITIRYPVEISSIAMPPSVARKEKAPFVVQIKNVSKKPLGLKTSEPRLLEINLSIPSTLTMIGVGFLDEKKEVEITSTAPIVIPVPILRPGETKEFVGTLQFADDAPDHTEALMDIQLQLGKVNDLNAKHIVAKRESALKLSQSYEYKPDADFILITNNCIKKEIIEAWQDMIMKLGSSLSLWDTTLYSGLSLTKKREDGRSLMDDMKNKVIIILNYPNKDDRRYPTEYLDAKEIFISAKNENISTYVVGKNFDLSKSMLPLDHQDHKNISILHEYFGTPSSYNMREEVDKQKNKLKKHHPDRRFLSFVEYKPTITNPHFSTFKKTWKLGEMHLAETLGRKDGHIAFRKNSDIISPDNIDLYHLVKLLPFSKKLRYLDRYSEPTFKDAIKKAIISDLTQELSICREEKWQEKEKSQFDLQYFDEFAKHEFKDKESFLELLMQYDYLISRVKSAWDFNAKYHRRKELYQVCHQQVTELFNHFSPKDYVLKQNILQTKWLNTRRKQVYAYFSEPYDKSSQMDSHVTLDGSFFQNELVKYRPINSTFKDNFSVCDTEEGFWQSVDHLKKGCRFP